jgi:hypothetical protein
MNCFAGSLKPIGLCCFPAIPYASQSRVPPACATYFTDLPDSTDQDAAAVTMTISLNPLRSLGGVMELPFRNDARRIRLYNGDAVRLRCSLCPMRRSKEGPQ